MNSTTSGVGYKPRPARWSARNWLTLAGALFIISYSTWQLWLWWVRNEPLDKAAHKIARAYANGDTSTLWHYSYEQERDRHSLSREKFDRIFREYIYPAVKRTTEKDYAVYAAQNSDLYQMVVKRRSGTREILIDFVVFRTPDGPRSYVINPGVVFVLQEKYGQKYENMIGTKKQYHILHDGILGEKQILLSYGLEGMLDGSPGNSLMHWDYAVKMFKKSFEIQESPQGTAKPEY